MKPITDQANLKRHMIRLFFSVQIPGLSIHIRDLSYEMGTVTLDYGVAGSLVN